ncbi:hypothetical protein [Halocatena salina]|uniref:Uncharacterized protein n=1 Tax=Halocatena salina TaxID=2934340 RepID=A0A8U0A8V4_9EURY|nr:hypothetical protein [Halocatena salina]UPM44327.1 hypothetical protein MW046_15065 [Halocatena salina]
MTREDPDIVLSDDTTTVAIHEHTTPNGTRLAIRPESGPGCRLDALELECVTWQEEGFLQKEGTVDPTHSTGKASAEPHATLRIGNEYALVELRAVEIDTEDRLLIESVKMGYTIVLGPSELATLARQEPSFFSTLLETPLGPEPDDLVEFH